MPMLIAGLTNTFSSFNGMWLMYQRFYYMRYDTLLGNEAYSLNIHLYPSQEPAPNFARIVERDVAPW